MTTLPDKVQIGPISFQVQQVDDLHTTNDDGTKKGLNGHILYDSATIKVESGLADDMKIAVMWHEVIHGLLDQAGIDEHPEKAIIVLGYGLVRVLRDNPALVQATIGELSQGVVIEKIVLHSNGDTDAAAAAEALCEAGKNWLNPHNFV